MIRFAMAAAVLAASAGAQANTVVINQVVDATTIGNGTSPYLYSGPPFTLAVGDTLDVNLSFLPGQALLIESPFVVGLGVQPSGPGISITTQLFGSMAFAGLQGAAHDPTPRASHSDGNGFGVDFFHYEFLDDPTSNISFTGVQFSATILSYSDGSTEQAYDRLYLFGQGDSVSVVAAVPEPASWLIVFTGLAALAGVSRTRRKKVAAGA
ncbi:MAG TPA: PEP-CTERM sorting domain-containing protein [Burkholderiaceae bacterium]|jgi:hypothetical protein